MEIINYVVVVTAIGLALMAGIAIGIYITTQISDWIDKQTKK
jgi:uncharacterized protein YneF (UPF0154 family)